jgi:hypothetical protein
MTFGTVQKVNVPTEFEQTARVYNKKEAHLKEFLKEMTFYFEKGNV